jgi:hypothetical protein
MWFEGEADVNGVVFLLKSKDLEMDFVARAEGVGAIPLFEDIGIIGDARLIIQGKGTVRTFVLVLKDQVERCQITHHADCSRIWPGCGRVY